MSGDPGLRLGIVPLRPLTVAELVGGALDAVRRNPGALLGVGFGVAVLAEVASWLAALVVFGGRPAPADLGGDIGHVLASYGAVLLRTAVVGVVGVVLAAAVNTAVPRAVFGHTTSARAALRGGGSALPALLGVAVLTALLVAGAAGLAAVGALAVLISPLGAVLALPPLALLVYLTVALVLAPSVAVVERATPIAALRRSRELVHDGAGGWWRVFAVALIAGAVGLVLDEAVSALFDLVSGGAAVAGSLASVLVAAVVAPWTMALHALLYVDGRCRAEGTEGLWRTAG